MADGEYLVPELTAEDLESSESESDGELIETLGRPSLSHIAQDTTTVDEDSDDEAPSTPQTSGATGGGSGDTEMKSSKPTSSIDESFSYAKLFLTTNTVASQLAKKSQNKCERCDRTVYFAEQAVAAGKKYHKRCFKCIQCNKQLAQGDFAEKNDNIFCKQCHKKAFGIKGYGHGVGSGVLNTYKIPGGEAPKAKPAARKCPNCQKEAPNTEQAFCGECGSKIDDAALTAKLKSMSLQPTPRLSSNPALAAGSVQVRVKPDSCHRCGKTAYFAERVNGAGRWYHKRCFKCSDCKRQLESKSMHEHESELYCHRCYMAHFGAKGFGYGKDTLHFTS